MQQHRMIFGVIIAACMLNPIYLVNAINEASVLELYLSDEVRRIVEEQMPVLEAWEEIQPLFQAFYTEHSIVNKSFGPSESSSNPIRVTGYSAEPPRGVSVFAYGQHNGWPIAKVIDSDVTVNVSALGQVTTIKGLTVLKTSSGRVGTVIVEVQYISTMEMDTRYVALSVRGVYPIEPIM